MPSEILRPGQVPRRLSGIDRRAELIAQEGVDELLVIAFTHELSLLSPAAFAEQVLVGQAGAVHVVVGENYRFGHAAEGDVETLVALGEQLGFGVTAVSLVTADGERVSSSWIRELVRQGEVMHATRLLGRAPWLDGRVVRGFARGRALGVPTANLRWTPGRVVPGARHLRRLRRARAGRGRALSRRRSRSAATRPSATSRARSSRRT